MASPAACEHLRRFAARVGAAARQAQGALHDEDDSGGRLLLVFRASDHLLGALGALLAPQSDAPPSQQIQHARQDVQDQLPLLAALAGGHPAPSTPPSTSRPSSSGSTPPPPKRIKLEQLLPARDEVKRPGSCTVTPPYKKTRLQSGHEYIEFEVDDGNSLRPFRRYKRHDEVRAASTWTTVAPGRALERRRRAQRISRRLYAGLRGPAGTAVPRPVRDAAVSTDSPSLSDVAVGLDAPACSAHVLARDQCDWLPLYVVGADQETFTMKRCVDDFELQFGVLGTTTRAEFTRGSRTARQLGTRGRKTSGSLGSLSPTLLTVLPRQLHLVRPPCAPILLIPLAAIPLMRNPSFTPRADSNLRAPIGRFTS